MTCGHHVTLKVPGQVRCKLGRALWPLPGEMICFVDELSACVKKNCNERHQRMRRPKVAQAKATNASPQIPHEISYHMVSAFRVSFTACDEISLISLYIPFHFVPPSSASPFISLRPVIRDEIFPAS